MKINRPLFVIAALVFLFAAGIKAQNNEIAIIPKPVNIDTGDGYFILNEQTKLYCPDSMTDSIANYFNTFINVPTGLVLIKTGEATEDNVIKFIKVNDTTIGGEGYILKSGEHQIVIKANDYGGMFYGVQTILQLLPPEIFSKKKINGVEWKIPSVTIRDYPRFGWRGMHLDVSRHFFPKEFIKKYLDLIAMHKMNVFHWHLTDNNGWRLEIKKYPKLTEISAWHVDRENEPWRERTPPKPGEKATYGGFYTQEDVKEIVKYAAERNIMVIPEIEMPGHTGEVFAAYPELSCSGKKTYVSPGGWPGEDIFCAGNDSVFVFLENVLDEVFELFPAPYVHIGGDEADKKTWKKCPKCQQRIKDEHLKDEDELQSWFVKKIEDYIVAHGKKLIGWDEILEGGLAPEATVMSWRGEKGGVESAKQGHNAIMCPVGYCYFDYYQANPKFEPEAIGGYTTLKKVYSYEPVPEELSEEDAKYILGGQGNVWTEFMATPEHAEYMAVPRMTALAEVLWSPKSKRNWEDFRKRLNVQFKRFDYMGVNYSKGSWKVDIKTEKSKDGKSFKVKFETEQPDYPVYYTLDGTTPDTTSLLYTGPFKVDSSVTIKAGIFVNGKLMRDYSQRSIYFNKATCKPVELKYKPVKRYSGKGAATLVDGVSGTIKHGDGNWLGFRYNGLDLIIDLKEKTEVSKVVLGFLNNYRSWIFPPAEVKVQVLNKKKKPIAEKTVSINYEDFSTKYATINSSKIEFEKSVKGRYVRVVAKPLDSCPKGHPGEGKKCWMFVDEVIVE